MRTVGVVDGIGRLDLQIRRAGVVVEETLSMKDISGDDFASSVGRGHHTRDAEHKKTPPLVSFHGRYPGVDVESTPSMKTHISCCTRISPNASVSREIIPFRGINTTAHPPLSTVPTHFPRGCVMYVEKGRNPFAWTELK
jgi:hypothetical protein